MRDTTIGIGIIIMIIVMNHRAVVSCISGSGSIRVHEKHMIQMVMVMMMMMKG